MELLNGAISAFWSAYLFQAGVLVLGLILLLMTVRSKSRTGRRKSSLSDPTTQMHYVSKAQFRKTKLLNIEESRILPILEHVASAANSGLRVMAQTSLAELIRPTGQDIDRKDKLAAFSSIHSKRIDFAIIDKQGFLACAIEYNGTDHFTETSHLRDAVKREAIRKAGVPFVAIEAHASQETVENQVRQALQLAEPA